MDLTTVGNALGGRWVTLSVTLAAANMKYSLKAFDSKFDKKTVIAITIVDPTNKVTAPDGTGNILASDTTVLKGYMQLLHKDQKDIWSYMPLEKLIPNQDNPVIFLQPDVQDVDWQGSNLVWGSAADQAADDGKVVLINVLYKNC